MVESFSKTFFFPNEEEIKKIAIFRNAKKVYCTYHKNEKLSKVGTHPIIGTQINLTVSNIIGTFIFFLISFVKS